LGLALHRKDVFLSALLERDSIAIVDLLAVGGVEFYLTVVEFE